MIDVTEERSTAGSEVAVVVLQEENLEARLPKKSNEPGLSTADSSVHVTVSENDPQILIALIDRTAPVGRVLEDLRRELQRNGSPYRDVDPRIFEAVDLKIKEGLSYVQASLRVFGTPRMAERIRYWRNRLGQ